MNKNERNILDDIPANKFHSVVFTSFSLDLINFDSRILRLLQGKNICSVNVLVDQRQLDQYIEFSIPSLRYIGKEYSISGILSKGAFHPKMSMFVGNSEILLLYGSGNLTVPGQGKNHEVFSGFYANDKDKKQLPLIKEAWDYLLKYTKNIKGYVNTRIEKEIPESSLILKEGTAYTPHNYTKIDESLSAALLYNDEDSSISEQISKLIPSDDVKSVTVVSPYFDEDGSSLNGILKLFQKAKMDIVIQENCKLPPTKMPSNKRVRFIDFDQTDRGELDSISSFGYKSFLHAKIFHFKTFNDEEYCIIGSANATKAALGFQRKAINDEFCVLLRSRKRHFLKELGLTKKPTLATSVSNMKREVADSSNPISKKTYQVKIDTIDYYEGNLKVFLSSEKVTGDFYLSGYDADGCRQVQQKIVLNEDLELIASMNKDIIDTIVYFVITDESDNPISNKQCVNNVEYLNWTNPSEKNRIVLELLSQLDSDDYDSLDILSFISDILSDIKTEELAESSIMQKGVSRGNSDYKREKSLAKYEKPYVLGSNNDTFDGAFKNNLLTVSKLIDCLEAAIKMKTLSINDELFGEEDDKNNAIRSADRENHSRTPIKMDKGTGELAIKKIIRFLNNYNNYINVRENQIDYLKRTADNHVQSFVNELDIEYFIVSIHSILDVCCFSRSRYDFTNSPNPGIEKNNFVKSLSSIVLKRLPQLIENFTLFSVRRKNSSSEKALKAMALDTLSYVFLAFYYVEKKEMSIHEDYIIKGIQLCLINLLDVYGFPDIKSVKDKLTLLSNYFDKSFDVENVIKYAESFYVKQDNKLYQKFENFGYCIIPQKGKSKLEYDWQTIKLL